ncbi:protein HGH1 homolog [Eucyclogobius newberryi]|uniref:protein HGH1 homolog n=1 Tax=Eucyclogobius newberryi TaxID=166745 RepID=UPI003B5CE5D3
MNEAEARELLTFLKPESRADVKEGAAACVLGVSGHRDGALFLGSKPDVLRALLTLTSDPSITLTSDPSITLTSDPSITLTSDPSKVIKDVYYTFINLSAEEPLHQVLLSELELLPLLCKNLLDPTFPFSDQICSVLCNLSRSERSCPLVFKVLQDKVGVSKLVEIFCCETFNSKATLHYIGPLLSNLSQLQEARDQLLDPERCVLQRLLPFTQYEASTVRRGGVIGTLRNCCFNHNRHEWLLSNHVDILPFLLLPLAGPEELSEEENQGLPVDLQFLPEDKQREPDPDLRKMLLETLLLLCATSRGRSVLKDRHVYPLMREFHTWETNPEVQSAVEKLIQVLIGDEPQSGMENLMEVSIPEEVEQKLKEADAKEQEELNQVQTGSEPGLNQD